VSLVAEQLGRASRDTRTASRRSWLSLAVLTIIAIGAVAAGIIAKSAEFWGGASIVFYLALATVITYAATQLGIVSNTATLLRAALKADSSTPEQTKSAQLVKAAPDVGSAALALARRFEEAGQLTEAEYAYLMAVQENGNRDALYWLGRQYVMRQQYKEGEGWLLKAADSGHALAAYLLGCLHRIHGQAIDDKIYTKVRYATEIATYITGRNELIPDGERLEEYGIVRSKANSEILRDLACALPDHIEFWQAYFVSLLRDDRMDGARVAIDKAVKDRPDNHGLRLLQIRSDSSHVETIRVSHFIAEFPDCMHPELHFHIALKLINDDHKVSDADLYGEDIREAIAEAEREDKSSWRSQLLALKAAYEYRQYNNQEAAELLEAALAFKPRLVEPLSAGDVRSLALILKSLGDKASELFISELIFARPKLKEALGSGAESREPLFKALISSMVPGIDIGAPIPGSPALGVAEVHQLVDSADGQRESKEQTSTGAAETEA
jgi:tetratricopeptide (TPR) repeat protein